MCSTRFRQWAVAVAVPLFSCIHTGCANSQLRVSTVRQAKTLTDLQYQQVLDNMAMFAQDPNAVPWLLSLKNGSTQVSDQGNVGVSLSIASTVTTSPGLNGTRSIVDQWGTAPVTEDNTLKILRKAFQTALGHPSFLSEHEANDIGHDLSQQIGTNADISTDTDTLRTLVTIIKEGQPPPPAGRKTSDLTSWRDESEKWNTTAAQSIRHAIEELDHVITSTLDAEFLEYDTEQNRCKSACCNNATHRQLHVPSHEHDHRHPHDPNQPLMFRIIDDDCKVSTGLTKETARRINEIQEELINAAERGTAWFHVGGKHDVPKDACFVGHYKGCGGDYYVWVCPDGRAALADFTITILKLSDVFKETQTLIAPTGIQFSPTLARPSFGGGLVR